MTSTVQMRALPAMFELGRRTLINQVVVPEQGQIVESGHGFDLLRYSAPAEGRPERDQRSDDFLGLSRVRWNGFDFRELEILHVARERDRLIGRALLVAVDHCSGKVVTNFHRMPGEHPRYSGGAGVRNSIEAVVCRIGLRFDENRSASRDWIPING